MKKGKIVFLLLFTLPSILHAQPSKSKSYIPIGKAKIKSSKLAFLENSKNTPLTHLIRQTVRHDLKFTLYFSFSKSFSTRESLEKRETLSNIRKKKGIEFLIQIQPKPSSKNLIAFQGSLYDLTRQKKCLDRPYQGKDAQTLGHTFANDIFFTLTGKPGIFLSKILFVSNYTGHKEIYMMNFDGTNKIQLTNHRSIAFAPNWHPTNTKIIYSLFKIHPKTRLRTIGLYELNLLNRKLTLLSNPKQMCFGGSYSPDQKVIAYIQIVRGKSKISLMNAKTYRPLFTQKGSDLSVEPTFQRPHGNHLAYVSDRTGEPMIYIMNKTTLGRKLTHAGCYNVNPSWSGNKIAFSGWSEGRFDIFLIQSNGSQLERLTRGPGNSEEPDLSPNGEFIVFTSNRTGEKKIHLMNQTGSGSICLTRYFGECTSPRWSY